MAQDRDEMEKRRLANYLKNDSTRTRGENQFQSIGDLLRTATKGKPKPPKVKKRALPIIPRQTKTADELPPPSGEDFTNRQLYLFQKFLANTDDDRDSLSNAIDLWDSVPRYSVSRQAMNKVRIQGRFLDKHEMTFEHRNHSYTRINTDAET